MKNINIGIEIDIQKLLDTRLLIQAGSGGGKSYALRQVIESIGNQVQQIILDPEGEFVTLREKFDFALVGKEGDIPLSLKYAETLAHKILETGISVIVDLYEFKAHERVLFVKRFLDALMNAPKALWHPCVIYVDEAHVFCPQTSESQSMSAVIDLCTRGRKRGFAAVLATQRLSKLHKDAAAECLNKMVGRTGLDIDRKRSGEELGMTSKTDMLQLRDLVPGEFYAFGPAISNQVTKFKVKQVLTTHLESGSRLASKPATPKAIEKILSKLSDIPEEAEKELVSRQQLQAEVVRLNGELKKLSKSPMAPPKIAVQDGQQLQLTISKAVASAKAEVAKQYDAVIKEKDAVYRITQDHLKKLQGILGKIHQLSEGSTRDGIKDQVPVTVTFKSKALPYIERHLPPVVAPVQTPSGANGTCTKPARAIISFLAGFQDRDFTKAQISVAIGYSSTSSSFQNAMGELNSKGFIIRGPRIKANLDKLAEIVGVIGDIVPFEFSAETFKNKLTKCELEIYEVLLENPHDIFSKESLAQQTPSAYSPTSSSFQNSLGRLNSLELISRQSGQIRLNPELIELMK